MSDDEKPNSTNERYMFEGFLIKEFLDLVKDGNLTKIESYVEQHKLDLVYIKDNNLGHNSLFYTTLIKDDNIALNAMKYFVKQGIDPLFKDTIGQTALYYAAREGKFLCCKYLLEIGCPLNEKDFFQQTPIYYASREGRLEILEMFIENGADIFLEDKFGQTCFFYAVREGHLVIVEYLIKKGIDINKLDKKRQNPLTFAYKYNRHNIIECLLENGAVTAKEANEKEKKMITKAKKKEDNNSSSKLAKIENCAINLKHRTILVKILDDGQKRPLTINEIEEFKKMCPEIYGILNDPIALEQIENEAPEKIRIPECWEKNAKKVLNVLWKVRDAEIFLKPVDPVELGIPDYFDIVKNPMDFSTVKRKLNQNLYTKCKEFVDDIELTFHNCIIYNGDKSFVGIMCCNVRNEFKRLCQQFNIDKYL